MGVRPDMTHHDWHFFLPRFYIAARRTCKCWLHLFYVRFCAPPFWNRRCLCRGSRNIIREFWVPYFRRPMSRIHGEPLCGILWTTDGNEPAASVSRCRILQFQISLLPEPINSKPPSRGRKISVCIIFLTCFAHFLLSIILFLFFYFFLVS